uniref:Uncharacterized protein n=1 Tax=Hippocampus comes TaxID=109280 RepID=A0A3Q2YTJ0_HIPCM
FTTSSQVRQNFHQDCEAAINRQINLELYASYVYPPNSLIPVFYMCGYSISLYWSKPDANLHKSLPTSKTI